MYKVAYLCYTGAAGLSVYKVTGNEDISVLVVVLMLSLISLVGVYKNV